MVNTLTTFWIPACAPYTGLMVKNPDLQRIFDPDEAL